MTTDSRVETYQHIHLVSELLSEVIEDLLSRVIHHDYSKLHEPELSVFNEYTDRLKASTYGSPEYEEFRRLMKPALDHHYANNRHHPEYYPKGVLDMTLIDVIEMLADWKAASMRHDNGNILTSIEHNQKRFGYGDELKQILLNTVRYLHY